MVPAFWSRTSEATVSWTFMLLKVVPPALVVSHVLIATVGFSHVFDNILKQTSLPLKALYGKTEKKRETVVCEGPLNRTLVQGSQEV